MFTNLLHIKKTKALISAVFFMLLVSSCATIFTGTTDEITFKSNVDPVTVYLGGRHVGETPLTLKVDRQMGKGPLVRFEKDGYKSQEFHLQNEFNWVSVLDISSVITSGGIDILTGAIMKYSPNDYHVEMIKTSSASLKDEQDQFLFAGYILFNSANIKKDIASGDGEYLNNLVSLLENDDNQSRNAKIWLERNRDDIVATQDPEELLALLREYDAKRL